MSPFEQIRHGLEQVWDSVMEGWEYLRRHATRAMTRFTPPSRHREVESAEDRFMHAITSIWIDRA